MLIKLLNENKLIICALGNLHYEILREKFEPDPGFEPRNYVKGEVSSLVVNKMADSVMTAPPGKSGIRLKREI